MAVPIFDDGNIDWGNTGTGGGGGDGSAPAPAPDELLDLIVDESGTLPVAYGRHAVRGTLILNKRGAGPPPTSVIFVALGEGPWDGYDTIYYAGEAIAGANIHFHPGTLSSGT